MKLNILFGGASYEHEISIVSAITLKEKLTKFSLSYIFCDTDHTLYLIDASKMKAKTFSSGEYKKLPKLTIESGAFVQKALFGSTRLDGVVLNLVHGGDGEDGTIASLLEFFHIPFIGPRVDASVLSFDKHYTKLLCDAVGVKALEYEVLTSNDKRELKTPLPFIVKPSRLGSSIGISIVKEQSELEYALDVAFEFDKSVIVEPFVAGVREFNLAGFKAGGELVFSNIEEVSKEEFLDFEKKYMDFSDSQKRTKADLSEALEVKMREAFRLVYGDLFDGSLIRCDFFVIDNEIYLNEINPIPGSMANYLFDDFEGELARLASSLPSKKRITTQYSYIHSISQAKGK